MNKNDLVAHVADHASITKADAAKAVDAVLDAIGSALEQGNEIRLVGFGTFLVAERKETKGRNPQTKEEIIIPASRQVKFKVGADLKRRVNPSK